jgi:hypothetical protein
VTSSRPPTDHTARITALKTDEAILRAGSPADSHGGGGGIGFIHSVSSDIQLVSVARLPSRGVGACCSMGFVRCLPVATAHEFSAHLQTGELASLHHST